MFYRILLALKCQVLFYFYIKGSVLDFTDNLQTIPSAVFKEHCDRFKFLISQLCLISFIWVLLYQEFSITWCLYYAKLNSSWNEYGHNDIISLDQSYYLTKVAKVNRLLSIYWNTLILS